MGSSQWQTAVTGEADISVAVVQPILFLQLGGGTYLRSSAASVFDIENDSYSIPLGVGIGKVVPAGSTVFNMFLEPQFTVAHDGAGQPAFQVYAGINLQVIG